jgi:hypothetical protein
MLALFFPGHPTADTSPATGKSKAAKEKCSWRHVAELKCHRSCRGSVAPQWLSSPNTCTMQPCPGCCSLDLDNFRNTFEYCIIFIATTLQRCNGQAPLRLAMFATNGAKVSYAAAEAFSDSRFFFVRALLAAFFASASSAF